MKKLFIPYTDGNSEETIFLREDGVVGIYDGSWAILIDPSGWKDFVEAVNKMDKLLVLK
jgi:hypothetical protein